jgi:hypothetical protein
MERVERGGDYSRIRVGGGHGGRDSPFGHSTRDGEWEGCTLIGQRPRYQTKIYRPRTLGWTHGSSKSAAAEKNVGVFKVRERGGESRGLFGTFQNQLSIQIFFLSFRAHSVDGGYGTVRVYC